MRADMDTTAVSSLKALTAPTDDAPSFANLPSDIFKQITETFDLGAISTLRQVSHSLNAAATNELYTKCFAHRTTDLTTKSLNDLIGVCSSPEFGRYVQSITIRASYWRLDELEKQLKEKKVWRSEGGGGPIFCSRQLDLSDEELKAAQKNFDTFKDLNNDQTKLKAGGNVATLLSTALRALGERNLSIKLEAVVYRESLEQRLAARSLISQCAAEMQKIMNDAFKDTVMAISTSSVKIEAFEVFDPTDAGHVSLDALYESFANLMDDDKLGTNGSALEVPRQFHSLQSLTLNLSPSPYTEIRPAGEKGHDDLGEQKPAADPQLHAAHLTTLRSILTACCTTLSLLDVRVRGLHNKHYLDSLSFFGSLPTLPELTTLHLRGILINPNSLFSLLTGLSKLETLGLHRVSLGRPADHPDDKSVWLPIFSLLRTLPSLHTFETNGLTLGNFSTRIFPSSPESALARIPKEHYTSRIFYEGCPCVTFTGVEVRGEQPPTSNPTETETAEATPATPAPRGYDNFRWGAPTHPDEDGPLDIEEISSPSDKENPVTTTTVEPGTTHLSPPLPPGWTPIKYRIGKRRPLGSPYLYRWHNVSRWEYALF